MSSPAQQELFKPRGDPARHVPLEGLTAAFRQLPAPPPERGVLVLIATRSARGVPETPASARLTVSEGLEGDAWSRRPPLNLDMQLAVMRHDVAESIANGQSLTTFGDNLFVALDISRTNLPAGTRLALGDCVVEVTPQPHNGCRKFRDRFGQDALRFTGLHDLREHNPRGVYWKVIQSGVVRVGDAIEVVSRGRAPV